MKKLSLIILFLFSNAGLAISLKTLPFNETIIKKISEGELYVMTDVTTPKNDKSKQTFLYKAAGLHKKDCRFALRKLSLYENYSQYMSVVKKSTYDEKAKNIYLLLSSKILPVDFSLSVNLPRITGPGSYPYIFNQGFLKGLKGEIQVAEEKNRCLIYAFADWQGPDSGYNNTIFAFFSKTVIQLSMENLFRISSMY